MHLEAEDLGLVAPSGLRGDQRRVDLEEHVVEGGAEVGAVDGGVFGGFRVVDVFASVWVGALAGVSFGGCSIHLLPGRKGGGRKRGVECGWENSEMDNK